jgi:phospholipid/cholesterol/gamma-HCH transport system substrate-binding protein
MTTRKTELLVGIFVLLTIAATLLLALKVANQGLSGNEHSYTLYAKFDNIGGLQPRSAVKVGGVTIGRVNHIFLDPDDFTPVVVMEISQAYNNFPDTSSVAILTSGLLGEQYIGFQPGFAFDDPIVLVEGDYIQDTKSALVLADLFGHFLFSRDSE